MRNIKPAIILFIFIVSIVSTLIVLTQFNYRFADANPGGNDFMARWMGASYWIRLGISPYDERVSQATQRAFYGRLADKEAGEDLAHFIYPLTSMVFFAPFALLDYVPARALWMTLLEVSLFFLALISLQLVEWKTSLLKRVTLILFSIVWYHGLRTIFLGQFAVIEALLIIAALLMIKKGEDFAAGFLLALATSKPQLGYLIILFVLLWSIFNKRFDILWGFLMLGGLLFTITLVFIPDWPLQMLRQILEYPSYTITVSPLSIAASSLPGLKTKLSIILHGVTAAYLMVEWVFGIKKGYKRFIWTAYLTLVVTNLITVRTATTNYLVLLPVLFFIWKNFEERWRTFGKILVGLLLICFLLGLWWLFITTIQGNQESSWMYLPLPFFCLGGLWWIKWWHLNPPKVLADHFYNSTLP